MKLRSLGYTNPTERPSKHKNESKQNTEIYVQMEILQNLCIYVKGKTLQIWEDVNYL